MHVNPKQRRRHSAAFKTEVLAACAEPGASVAAVALAFKLNDTLEHHRLLEPIGYIAPAEAEANYHRHLAGQAVPA